MHRTLTHSLLSRLSGSILARHPLAALLAPVVVASGVAGFVSGQVAGHLPRGLALAPPAVHQASGRVQGSLGQRPGGSAAHQPVVRTVYVPQATTPTTSARPRQSGSQGAAHANKGSGAKGKGDKGKGDKGKGDKGGKGDRGKGHHGKGDKGHHSKGGHGGGGKGHDTGSGRPAGGHGAHGGGGGSHPAPPTQHKHGHS